MISSHFNIEHLFFENYLTGLGYSSNYQIGRNFQGKLRLISRLIFCILLFEFLGGESHDAMINAQ